jgi:hypothetical protein
MKPGTSGYSVLAAPEDGRTPPRPSPAVTDPSQRGRDARISAAETNPQGWQRVADGRSGQRGNDHRKTASDGRASREGVPEPRRPDRSNHLTTA